jgi:ATP synthase protein I
MKIRPYKDKPFNIKNFAKFSGLAFQMLAVIGFGVALGVFLDKQFKTENIFTAICSLVFVFASIYLVVKEVIKHDSTKK